MLAEACRRGGLLSQEATIYYNRGALLDNQGKYDRAILEYEKFLSLCRRLNDIEGEAIAYNALGVDFQMLGGAGTYKAIQYHLKHLEVADMAGKFTAHCNLGLSYAALGEQEKAAVHHRHALRIAVRSADLLGEAVACGNLGASVRGDAGTARACLERHVRLGETLGDGRGQAEGMQRLGEIALEGGEREEAARCFEEAMAVAARAGERELYVSAKCGLAAAIAERRMGPRIAEIGRQLHSAVAAARPSTAPAAPSPAP
eukprot:tig00000944_g5948.t1